MELAVIGANAIGLEMGQLVMRLGSKVTFLEAMPRITPLEEPEVSETMQGILQEDGATVLSGVKISSVAREGDRRDPKHRQRSSGRQTHRAEGLAARASRAETTRAAGHGT